MQQNEKWHWMANAEELEEVKNVRTHIMSLNVGLNSMIKYNEQETLELKIRKLNCISLEIITLKIVRRDKWKTY